MSQNTVQHTVLLLLLSLGTIVSLVLIILSFTAYLFKNTTDYIPEIAIPLVAFIVCFPVAIGLYWIALQLFGKRNLAAYKLYLRQQNEEIGDLTHHIDANPALDYLGNESAEEKDSAELLDNAINLFSIEIKECIIPRNEIIGVEIRDDINSVRNTFIDSKHSKLIVYENDTDNILGYVHHSDFYEKPQNLQDLIREIPAVPETMTAIEMLSFFKKKQKSIAWVVDEFGGTSGILTTEDLLEELFGEIEDEHDESEYIEQQISAAEFILSGRLEVEYINDKFDLDIPILSAETISGYVIDMHNQIPEKDEKIVIGKYEFKILQVSKTRIETVRLKKLEE